MKVRIAPKAQKTFLKLSANIQKRIGNQIDNLEKNHLPANVKKLTNQPGYRIRVGDYRILYIFNPKQQTITIVSIAHRSTVYRKVKL